MKKSYSVNINTLTFHCYLSTAHQVTLVAHKNDGNILCLTDTSQLDAQL